MVTAVTYTTEKRGVVFTFLSRLLYNSKILCKFAQKYEKLWQKGSTRPAYPSATS